MKIHWRTEDRWLREFGNQPVWRIARDHFRTLYAINRAMRKLLRRVVEEGIRRAIERRERRKQ